MHLAILTQYYPPETGAPQRRLSNLARHFRDCGHSVSVLTAMPNYPQGRTFEGYGGLYKCSVADGIQLVRSFIYPTKKTKTIPRLLSYFSFVFSSLAVGSVGLRPPDYLLIESPPLFLGISGYLLSRIKSAKLIFNVSDLWPESAARLGVIARSGFGYRVAESLEAFCYRKAWLITGQSKSILQDIHARFPKARCFHLSNGADSNMFQPGVRAESAASMLRKKNGEFLAAYVGLHGLAQGLEQLLAAAQAPQATRLRFLLIGDGPCKQDLQDQVRQQELSNVEFFDLQPADAIPALLAEVDVLLVMLKTDIPGAVPSKLYEAMAMAKPVVLVGAGEGAEIVRESECGIVVAPGDVRGLAEGLQALRLNPDLCRRLGENGRRAVLNRYDRTQIAHKFVQFLENDMRNTNSECHESSAVQNL